MRTLGLLALLAGCDVVFPIDKHGAADASFDAADASSGCPDIYNVTLPSTVSSSSYFVIRLGENFNTQRATCLSHSSDRTTHLARLESGAEMTAIHAYFLANVTVPVGAEPYVWVGLLQADNAAQPEDDWSWLLGGDLYPALWDRTDPANAEPDDDDRDETIAGTNQDHGCIDLQSGYLHDRAGAKPLMAICECDGLAEP